MAMSPFFPRFLLASVAAVSLLAAPARAQIPTTDGSVIPQMMQTAQTLSQQLAQVQAFQVQVQNTIQTLGGLGSLPQHLLGQLMSQLNPMSVLSDWIVPERACALDSCGDFLKDNVFQQRPGVPQMPSSPDFGAQREYVEARFFSPTDLDVLRRHQILDERQRAARAAARDGYAVALAARERVARAPQDAQRVVQVGSSGTTMREDIQRLSAVLMAIYQERQQQLALYAALLEVEGAGTIAADPNVVSPRARVHGPGQRTGAGSATRPSATTLPPLTVPTQGDAAPDASVLTAPAPPPAAGAASPISPQSPAPEPAVSAPAQAPAQDTGGSFLGRATGAPVPSR